MIVSKAISVLLSSTSYRFLIFFCFFCFMTSEIKSQLSGMFLDLSGDLKI